MNICPRCGNQIPTWAHGVCYTCARNEKEYKRYGRRRPSRRKRPKETTKAQTPTKQSCNKRNKRLANRMVNPTPKSVKKKQPSEIKTKNSRKGINRLLYDIYGQPTYLSGILQRNGLSRSHIDLLRQDHLESYLSHLIQSWVKWWQTILTPASVGNLINHYDLAPYLGKDSSATLNPDYLSSTEARHLRKTTLSILQTQLNKKILEHLALREARATVDKPAKA